MAITIDWPNKIIEVPQSYLTLISGSVYELDTDQFRLDLKDLEDGEQGISYLDTHRHNTEVSLGGVTFARTLEIINGYTITFEDGQYAVRLVGSNNNIADVTNVNQVSIRSQNAAGMVASGSGVTAQDKADIASLVWDEPGDDHQTVGTVGLDATLVAKILRNRTVTDPTAGTITVYDDDDSTVLLVADLFEDASGTVAYQGSGAERRDRLT